MNAALVTEADLTRARHDLEFRHRLLAANLERLLNGLNQLRGTVPEAERERQIREGVALAVKLADLLRDLSEDCGDDSTAA
jgi:hypothetical protein